MGSLTKYLIDLLPVTGRNIRENGEYVNNADVIRSETIVLPRTVVLRKQAYFFQHLRLDIVAGNVFYYSITSPADKHVIVFVRNIDVGQGPVRFETVVGATFTAGAPIIPINLYAGGPAGGTVITAGATGVTGGITNPADYLFGAGNKSPTASSGELPTIFPPAITVLAKITNESVGNNAGIRFALAFAEVDLSDEAIIV